MLGQVHSIANICHQIMDSESSPSDRSDCAIEVGNEVRDSPGAWIARLYNNYCTTCPGCGSGFYEKHQNSDRIGRCTLTPVSPPISEIRQSFTQIPEAGTTSMLVLGSASWDLSYVKKSAQVVTVKSFRSSSFAPPRGARMIVAVWDAQGQKSPATPEI
jgi:hypothetical protein